VPRSMMTVARAGNDLIFAGGGIPDFVFFDAVDIYHADTDTWSHTALSQQVFANTLAGAVVGEKALFIGSVGNPLNVDMYDANTEQWDTLQAPSSHQLNPVVANGNKVFFAGGLNNFTGKVDIYDVSTNMWSNGGALSVQRYYAAGASVGNKVLIAGGTGNSNVVDIYTLPSSGITTVGATPMIDLFPNPANEAFVVRFNQPVTGTFNLVSADGRVLRGQSLQAEETLELITATLPTGIYAWKWTPEAGTGTRVGKVLVQH